MKDFENLPFRESMRRANEISKWCRMANHYGSINVIKSYYRIIRKIYSNKEFISLEEVYNKYINLVPKEFKKEFYLSLFSPSGRFYSKSGILELKTSNPRFRKQFSDDYEIAWKCKHTREVFNTFYVERHKEKLKCYIKLMDYVEEYDLVNGKGSFHKDINNNGIVYDRTKSFLVSYREYKSLLRIPTFHPFGFEKIIISGQCLIVDTKSKKFKQKTKERLKQEKKSKRINKAKLKTKKYCFKTEQEILNTKQNETF